MVGGDLERASGSAVCRAGHKREGARERRFVSGSITVQGQQVRSLKLRC